MFLAAGCGKYGEKYAASDNDISTAGDEPRLTDADFTDEKVRAKDGCDELVEKKSEGRQHTTDIDEKVEYEQNPPMSGNHYQVATEWGIYDEPVKDVQAVHNLEHGHIWISYKGLSKEEQATLDKHVRVNPFHLLVAPRKDNPKKGVYYTTWTKQVYCAKPSEAALQYMIDNWRDQGPELFTDDESKAMGAG